MLDLRKRHRRIITTLSKSTMSTVLPSTPCSHLTLLPAVPPAAIETCPCLSPTYATMMISQHLNVICHCLAREKRSILTVKIYSEDLHSRSLLYRVKTLALEQKVSRLQRELISASYTPLIEITTTHLQFQREVSVDSPTFPWPSKAVY